MKYNISLKNKKPSSSLLYGLFLEDINHSIDGGLNANLIQNGSFDFSYFTYNENPVVCRYDHSRFWHLPTSSLITKEKPLSEGKPFSLKLEVKEKTEIKNLGYETYNNEQYIFLNDTEFKFSFFYLANASLKMEIKFEYSNHTNSKIRTLILPKTNKYKLFEINLKGRKSSYARIILTFIGKATIYLTHFKLIPNNYYQSANNAYKYGKFNASLVKSLDLGAKFLRFPGGCLVEGDVSCDYLYEWEKTIGPTYQRISKPSVWGYLQSNEIGFFEYFCLCEDLHLSPLPVHHVGLICQIRTDVFRHLGSIALTPNTKEFKEKVIDSLAHLIYFAKGNVNSNDKIEQEWAKKRKAMGHPKPFKLEMIALGNENWGDIYFRNFDFCYKELQNYEYKGVKANLLELFNIKIISSSGVDINPQDTNPSWQYINKHYSDLTIDEHVYNTPSWFIDNYYRYDYYNKEASKVFMGEYAAHSEADGKGKLGGKNDFYCALAESIFMMGLENNPQIVKMSCYAPLLSKQTQNNWDPDLIYFNHDKVHYTPSYLVQKLFAQNYGKYSLKISSNENMNNSGKFILKKNNNIVNKISFTRLDNTSFIPSEKEDMENYNVEIDFKELKDNFTLGFGIKDDFGYYLHYNYNDATLYYEKIVNNYRMTLETLLVKKLPNKIKIQYTNNYLKIIINNKELITKNIWKTNTNIFTSLTYDNKYIYLKVANIASSGNKLEFDFPKTLLNKQSLSLITTIRKATNSKDGYKTTIQHQVNNDNCLKVYIPKESINIIKINRK